MFSNPVRLVVVTCSLVAGLYQLQNGNNSGFLLIAASALLFYGLFRYGPVWLAIKSHKAGNVDKAQALLQSVRYPKLLASQSRAYWHWHQGIFAAEDPKQILSAKVHLEQALQHRLRTTNDRCLVLISLAELAILTKDMDNAKRILDDAKTLERSQPVGDLLAKIEAELNNVT